MSRAAPVPGRDLDTTPWYRQFWPWFLIVLPGSVVVAALTTVYIANKGADDLVVSDYYKNGLSINKQIEKQQRAASLGIEAQIFILEQTFQVRLKNHPTQDTLRLILSHPLEADQDQEIPLAEVAAGLYHGELIRPVSENWHWRLEPVAGEWRLDGTIGSQDFMAP